MYSGTNINLKTDILHDGYSQKVNESYLLQLNKNKLDLSFERM